MRRFILFNLVLHCCGCTMDPSPIIKVTDEVTDSAGENRLMLRFIECPSP